MEAIPPYTDNTHESRIFFEGDPFKEIKGIRYHSKVDAFIHNILSLFGLCSAVIKVEGNEGAPLNLNKRSLVRYLRECKEVATEDDTTELLIKKINRVYSVKCSERPISSSPSDSSSQTFSPEEEDREDSSQSSILPNSTSQEERAGDSQRESLVDSFSQTPPLVNFSFEENHEGSLQNSLLVNTSPEEVSPSVKIGKMEEALEVQDLPSLDSFEETISKLNIFDISTDDISHFSIFMRRKQGFAFYYLVEEYYMSTFIDKKYHDHLDSFSLRGKIDQFVFNDEQPDYWLLNYDSGNTTGMAKELQEIYEQSGSCITTSVQLFKWEFLDAHPPFTVLDDSKVSKNRIGQLTGDVLVQFSDQEPEWMDADNSLLHPEFRIYDHTTQQERYIPYQEFEFILESERQYRSLKKETLTAEIELLSNTINAYLRIKEILIKLEIIKTHEKNYCKKIQKYIENEKKHKDESVTRKKILVQKEYEKYLNYHFDLEKEIKLQKGRIESYEKELEKIGRTKEYFLENKKNIMSKINQANLPLLNKHENTEIEWCALLRQYNKILLLEEEERICSFFPYISWKELDTALKEKKSIPLFEFHQQKNIFIESVEEKTVTFLEFSPKKVRKVQKIEDFVQHLKPERFEGKDIIGIVSLTGEEDSSDEYSSLTDESEEEVG